MPTVIKSPAAEEDITEIWLYIAADNLAAANQFVENLKDIAELIATQPNIGVLRAALGEHIRSHAIGNYVIYYRPVTEGIELVRVLHGARDIPDAFGQAP